MVKRKSRKETYTRGRASHPTTALIAPQWSGVLPLGRGAGSSKHLRCSTWATRNEQASAGHRHQTLEAKPRAAGQTTAPPSRYSQARRAIRSPAARKCPQSNLWVRSGCALAHTPVALLRLPLHTYKHNQNKANYPTPLSPRLPVPQAPRSYSSERYLQPRQGVNPAADCRSLLVLVISPWGRSVPCWLLVSVVCSGAASRCLALRPDCCLFAPFCCSRSPTTHRCADCCRK